MKKYWFVAMIALWGFASSCEVHYYHMHHRHSDRYMRHHHGTRVDINVH